MNPIYDIELVVPHRGAMCFLDRLLAWDEDSVVAEARIQAGGLFDESDGTPAWVGIEYMAQAVAAWAGCHARAAGREPAIGFLLGSRRYAAAVARFATGAVLRVEARREILGDNGLGVFACRILEDETVLATANVSVYEPADAVAYLESEAK